MLYNTTWHHNPRHNYPYFLVIWRPSISYYHHLITKTQCGGLVPFNTELQISYFMSISLPIQANVIILYVTDFVQKEKNPFSSVDLILITSVRTEMNVHHWLQISIVHPFWIEIWYLNTQLIYLHTFLYQNVCSKWKNTSFYCNNLKGMVLSKNQLNNISLMFL